MVKLCLALFTKSNNRWKINFIDISFIGQTAEFTLHSTLHFLPKPSLSLPKPSLYPQASESLCPPLSLSLSLIVSVISPFPSQPFNLPLPPLPHSAPFWIPSM